jgi:adenosylmethionine-8-amino-7-oxononanoate aminotransferase
MTLAATLCRSHIAEKIDGPLMHGPTFMANPLAASAALASTELLAQGWKDDVDRIERGLQALHEAQELPGVKDVRVKGAIGVIQLDHPIDGVAATRAAVEHGVWLRPFRDLVYTMPPYVTDDDDIARICDAAIAGAAAG